MTVTEPEVGARDWREHDRDDLPPTLEAALTCFVAQGYHVTSIREIAAGAGLSVPGLYHHRSKQELLVACLRYAMKDLWWRSVAADDPTEQVTTRLAAQVECLVVFHARRRDLAFVAWSEIRGPDAAERAAHVGRRDRQTPGVIDEIVAAGVASGDFALDHPADTGRALVTMCTGVAQWYRPTGDLTPEDVAGRYVGMTLDLVRARPPVAPTPDSPTGSHAVPDDS